MADVRESELFKVVSDYKGEKGEDGECYLTVSKGDILIECQTLDKRWIRGKVITTDTYGKVPASCVVPFDSKYEDVEGTEKSMNMTRNPLCDEESMLEKRSLSQFGNYVDMSSDESINNEEKQNMVAEKSGQQINGKGSDEGYNSSSHYSGETQVSDKSTVCSSTTPLMIENRQDEAGYEVPSVCFRDAPKLRREEKRRKSLKSLLKVKASANNSLKEDDAREQYYDPPSDQSEKNFLPSNSFFALRIFLCFIAAISVFVILFLVFLLVCHLHVLVCFTLSSLVFLLILILPATLTRNHIACIATLLLPSIVSSKSKVAMLLLILVFLLIGPILGIINKLDSALFCSQQLKNYTVPSNNKVHSSLLHDKDFARVNNKIDKAEKLNKYVIKEDCEKSFFRVREYCLRAHDRFKRVCDRHKLMLSKMESEICRKDEKSFCFSNKTLREEICQAKTVFLRREAGEETSVIKLTEYLKSKKKSGVEMVSNYLLYVTPFLVLFLVWEAYSYNLLYLTTKANDNVYITRRIKELDIERQNRGLKDVIIPLTRMEFQYYLLRTTVALSKAEKRSLVKWLVIWACCLAITQSFVVLENYINDILISTQTDPCSWYYRAVTAHNFRLPLYLSIVAFILMILSQSYVLRLRSLICDYFYPDMVDNRSKYLYYKILHDRSTFSKRLKRKVQLLSEQKRLKSRISYCVVLKNSLPLIVRNAILKITISKCMICDSLSRKVIECNNVHCQAHFCFECFVDAGQTCLICRNRQA